MRKFSRFFSAALCATSMLVAMSSCSSGGGGSGTSSPGAVTVDRDGTVIPIPDWSGQYEGKGSDSFGKFNVKFDLNLGGAGNYTLNRVTILSNGAELVDEIPERGVLTLIVKKTETDITIVPGNVLPPNNGCARTGTAVFTNGKLEVSFQTSPAGCATVNVGVFTANRISR